MTVHRVKTCACGHADDFHISGTGPCSYGHGHTMGGCTCPAFGKRKRADGAELAATPVAPNARSLTNAIDATIRALSSLKLALAAESPVLRRKASKGSALPSSILESPRHPPARRAFDAGGGHLRAGERKLLHIAARHYPLLLTRAQLATLAGFTASGGTYQTYLSVLRRAGYLEERDRLLGVTTNGLAASGVKSHHPMNRDEVVEMWRGALRAGERTMLDLVLQHGVLTRTQLGAPASALVERQQPRSPCDGNREELRLSQSICNLLKCVSAKLSLM